MMFPTELGRYKERGSHDFSAIAEILDAGLICHVGLALPQTPVVLPTIYGRIDESLYIHGSNLARWMRNLADSVPLCVTVSIVDGIVFARSAYQHSLNYRSVVAFAHGKAVADRAEKIAALHAIVEHVCPGRWEDVRQPNDGEIDATTVIRVALDAASAKVRTGPPEDFPRDFGRGYWAGVVPMRFACGTPISDPQLEADIAVPPYIQDLIAARR